MSPWLNYYFFYSEQKAMGNSIVLIIKIAFEHDNCKGLQI